MQHLRGRRLTTAAQLAEWLEVSERTVYRDISALSRSGVPVEGEAGFGYRILRGFEVAPLMFSLDEVEALVTGLRIVESWGGPALAKASRSAVEKIAMALPAARMTEIESTRLFAPGFHLDAKIGNTLEMMRGAILSQHKLRVTYGDAAERVSERLIRPLALHFWGATWTLAAWCDTKSDFRSFRLDRCRKVEVSSETFRAENGKMLADFLKKVQSQSPRE